MPDIETIASEIKQQSIETRNMVIKSDNLVKNLSGDVRLLQKQLEHYHSRQRMFVFGGLMLIIALLAGAAWLTTEAQTAAADRHLAERQAELDALAQRFTDLQDQFSGYKANAERATSAQRSADQLASEILSLIDGKQEREAVLKARALDVSQLGLVASTALRGRLQDARLRQADLAYRNGKLSFERKLYAKAIPDLELALELAPDTSLAPSALYYLILSLAGNEERERTLQVADEFLQKHQRHGLADEVLYQKASSCERWGLQDCALESWQQLVTAHATSYYAPVARRKLKEPPKNPPPATSAPAPAPAPTPAPTPAPATPPMR